MQTKQHTTQNSSIEITDNLANANSVDDIYVYRDGDQLAVSTPVQKAEFHLDQLTWMYQGQMDVFQQVFNSAGDILNCYWTPNGFEMTIHDGRERHQIKFILRTQAGDAL